MEHKMSDNNVDQAVILLKKLEIFFLSHKMDDFHWRDRIEVAPMWLETLGDIIEMECE